MAKDRQKFIERQDKQKRAKIAAIVQDILDDMIDSYDCKPMEGMENHRRIKYNNIRIIFSKLENNEIVINKIGFR